jgi:hypothetical protein
VGNSEGKTERISRGNRRLVEEERNGERKNAKVGEKRERVKKQKALRRT